MLEKFKALHGLKKCLKDNGWVLSPTRQHEAAEATKPHEGTSEI